MRKTLWNPQARAELVSRIHRLKPDATPLWGRMTASQMLSHLVAWGKMAKGDLSTSPRNSILKRTPVKQFAIYWMPWPKGVPTAKELITGDASDWDAERARLCQYIEEFEAVHKERPWPDHPAFGRLTPATWGVLAYRHTDHHLRQFGV